MNPTTVGNAVGDFRTATQPVADPAHPGRYEVALGPEWKAFFIFGGVLLGAAVRAMSAEVDDPEMDPVSLHAMFLRPVPSGPVVIEVETLRAGRSVRQMSARVTESGHEDTAVVVQGSWGTRQDDIVTGVGLAPPVTTGPADPGVTPAIDDERFAHLPVNQQFEERTAPGWPRAGVFMTEPGRAQSAVWTRLKHQSEPPGHAIVALMADRVPGPHLGSTILGPSDKGIPARPIITLEITLRFVARPTSSWVLVHGTLVEAGGGYHTSRAVLWDENHHLVATADQTAWFANTEVSAPTEG